VALLIGARGKVDRDITPHFRQADDAAVIVVVIRIQLVRRFAFAAISLFRRHDALLSLRCASCFFDAFIFVSFSCFRHSALFAMPAAHNGLMPIAAR